MGLHGILFYFTCAAGLNVSVVIWVEERLELLCRIDSGNYLHENSSSRA